MADDLKISHPRCPEPPRPPRPPWPFPCRCPRSDRAFAPDLLDVVAGAIVPTDPRRLAVVEEALTWLRTPYHHMARVKGVGVDCLTLLAEVYERAGVIPHVDVPFYPPDWNLHRNAERYLDGIMRYAGEVSTRDDNNPPQPADIAVFKFGRCFAHGAIVLQWPRLIHAWHNAGVVYVDATQGELAGRPVRIFDPFSVTR